jgi:putative CocE/NonD family hydrolase
MRISPLLCLVVSAAGAAAQTEPRFEVSAPETVMVPMRDGVRLATDIYRPALNGAPAAGKFPAIMERTPYNKKSSAAAARYLVPHGYVVVLQDVRGRYASEGRWFPVRDDPGDGYDTAQWLGQQPWFDGNLGTMGSSYGGATQHALAIGGAPYLKAMVPRNAMSDFGRYGVRHNGAFELRWLNWIFTLGDPNVGSNLAAAAALSFSGSQTSS